MRGLAARWQLHEGLYLALGGALTAALAWRNGFGAPLPVVATAMLLYAALLSRAPVGGRARLLAAYVATWALYAGSGRLVEALRVPLRHETLLDWDTRLFGQTPAVALQGVLSAGWVEALALGYLSYHVYLHWALIEAWRSRDSDCRAGLSRRVFSAFAAGLAGYLLFPAAPPEAAFPTLFPEPLPGGVFSRLNDTVNRALAAPYDAFPSLHVLITATLLLWDWRRRRARFWIMLAPSLLMLAATLGLRLHYAVDLLASALLFAVLTLFHDRSLPLRR